MNLPTSAPAMKRRIRVFFVVAAGFGPLAGAVLAAPGSDLVPSRARQSVVHLAANLQQISPPARLAGDLANPFAPVGFDYEVKPIREEVVTPKTDRDILEA